MTTNLTPADLDAAVTQVYLSEADRILSESYHPKGAWNAYSMTARRVRFLVARHLDCRYIADISIGRIKASIKRIGKVAKLSLSRCGGTGSPLRTAIIFPGTASERIEKNLSAWSADHYATLQSYRQATN